MPYSILVKVRVQLSGIGLLPSSGSQGLNSDCQALSQKSLPVKPNTLVLLTLKCQVVSFPNLCDSFLH